GIVGHGCGRGGVGTHGWRSNTRDRGRGACPVQHRLFLYRYFEPKPTEHRLEKQMTSREKKLIALGAGAGTLTAVLMVGLLGAREAHFFANASAAAAPQPASSTQPVAAPTSAQG